MRFAPSIDVVRELRKHGVKLRAFDPVSMSRAKVLPEFKGVKLCKDEYEAVSGADAVAVVTEWKRFRELDLRRLKKAMRTPLILDGRNIFDPEKARALGFEYAGVGRP
jgi:UDPglucose 6-dehydrogenase